MRRQRNTFQVREHYKTPEKELSETETSDLLDKEFKQNIMRMLTDMQRRMDEHSEHISKELEDMKKNQSEMKNTIHEIRNSLEGLNSRVEEAEERISKLDERLEEITQAEQKREKRIRQNENSVRELWDNIKRANIRITGVPEGEKRDKGAENLFVKITEENFPHLRKETDIQVQEAQRAPNKRSPKRPTPRHIIIKMSKIKDKERILKAARERPQVTYKGKPIRLSADFSVETLQARREWHDIFEVLKGKNLQPRILYPSRLPFRMEGEIKSFPDKQKLKEFITNKPVLQEMRKGLI
uniref:L1 transposable element RRM domain-containing protein n=1 Tax=Equus caballus TaxID=9796 RepID=A0A9L0RNE6_HORSE